MIRKIVVSILLAVLALPAAALQKGIAVTPRNHPHQRAADLEDAFKKTKRIGNYAVFMMQWGRMRYDAYQLVMAKSRQHGLRTILGLSPTSLDAARKNLDVPAHVRRAAGVRLSFSNPVVQAAFLEDVRKLARLKPDYLCLGTEINMLGIQRIHEYVAFAKLYKQAYHLVKRISPGTKVFVSFQYDWMVILDKKAPHRVREHTKLVDIFRPELDVFALTSYPAHLFATPAKMPAGYYRAMHRHNRPEDEIMFMEIGWPSRGIGSQREQNAFLRRLPSLLSGTRTRIVAWSLLHDVRHDKFNDDLNTTGLLTNGGRRKPSWRLFMKLK